jgi:hypothetical protein
MKRREFLFLTLVSITGAYFSKTLSSVKVYVTEGKLGYKLKGNKGRQCFNCKHFEKKDVDGICKLSAMKNVMKVREVFVLPEATCNMWIQK